MLKIALVQNVPINDHRVVHTDGVARELVNRGYDVEVVIQGRGNSNSLDRPYKVVLLPGETYSILGQLLFEFHLVRYLIGKRFDIIHAKNPFSSVLPAFFFKKGARVIYDIRGLWIDFGVHDGTIPSGLAPLLGSIDVFCMNRADRVIAISDELKRVLVSRGVKDDKIEVVVGDGVDLEKIHSLPFKDIRDLLGVKGRVIGYVGSIGRSRASERIIEAFEIVKRGHQGNVYLAMVGPCREYDLNFYLDLVRQKGLENSIFFTGYLPHDEVLSYLKSFDLTVAYHEGNVNFFNVAVPTKILEYMACGCPIVTTNQRMYKNLLTHEENGYLTKQNINSFAEGILCVLKNNDLKKSMARKAFENAHTYSIKKIVDQIEMIFKNQN
jgi:glycosyltransferase involved in cell wall biosynthesis